MPEEVETVVHARSITAPAAATLTALIASFVNQVVAAAVLGMSSGLDAYLATNAVCSMLLAAFGGAFTVAMAGRGARREHQREASGADLLVALAAGSVMALALVLWREPIGAAVAAGPYGIAPELVGTLLILNAVGMAANITGTVASGLLVGRGQVLLGLSSPALVSIGGIIAVMVFGNALGASALAAGTLVGAAIRALGAIVLLQPALPSASDLLASLRFWATSSGLLWSGMIVAFVGVADKASLGGSAPGVVSQVTYAIMLLTSSAMVMSSALGAPLARRYELESEGGRWTVGARTLRLSMAVLLPLAAWLVAAANGIPGLLLGWGRVRTMEVASIGAYMQAGGGVLLSICLTGAATYLIHGGHHRYALVASTSGAFAAVLAFYLLRPSLGAAAVPVGYSLMYIGVSCANGLKFLALGGGRAFAELRYWGRCVAVAAVIGLAVAVAGTIVRPLGEGLALPMRSGIHTVLLAGVGLGIGAHPVSRLLREGMDSEGENS